MLHLNYKMELCWFKIHSSCRLPMILLHRMYLIIFIRGIFFYDYGSKEEKLPI